MKFLILYIFFIASCKSSLDKIQIEDIEFSESQQEKFYLMNDKRNQNFLGDIRKIQETHESFSADFSLKVERYLPKKEKFYADGKIYFSRSRGSLRIQLMDTFFGIIFSDILATHTLLQVRDSKSERIHSQPMGDLFISDPARDKEIIHIPFPVLYYSITGSYLKEFSQFPSFFSPEQRRVLVRKNGDEFTYFFDERRLNSLEWYDRNKNTRAVAAVDESSGFPPVSLVTKVLEEGGKESFTIVTRLRNVKKAEPPDRAFLF